MISRRTSRCTSAVEARTEACDAATLGEVYNPDGGARGACAGGTCAIGDVCARMDAGMIASVGGKTYEFVDRNLPLAGRRSVSGRALAVWRGDRAAGLNGFSAGKVPFACATIEEDDDEDGFVEARATLGTTLSKISGLVTLRQSAADAAADTRISVQLVNRAQGDAIGPYRWAIYSGTAGSSNSCAHVGRLYNPEEKSSCASRGAEALAEDCPIGEIWVRQGTLSSSEIVLYQRFKPATERCEIDRRENVRTTRRERRRGAVQRRRARVENRKIHGDAQGIHRGTSRSGDRTSHSVGARPSLLRQFAKFVLVQASIVSRRLLSPERRVSGSRVHERSVGVFRSRRRRRHDT